MTRIERLKRWGLLAAAAGYLVFLFASASMLAQNPAWQASLWLIKTLVYAGIFFLTFLVGNYFLRVLDMKIKERDLSIKQLERLRKIEEETNEEVISINQMVNEQVIQLTKLREELETALVDTLNTLARALDSRDQYTHGHSERVTKWSLLIAERVGYNRDDLHRLRQSALLHDIGKIGVDDSILKKEGPLTEDERKQMQMHTIIGYEIIKDAMHFEPCLNGIRFHHERIDGKGYPDGLKGEEIPQDARIIAVGDSFDAMTSDRPYRKGMPREKALTIIKEVRGTQLDLEIVDIFLELVVEVGEIDKAKVPVGV